MDIEFIQGLVELARKEHLRELEYRLGDSRLSLRFPDAVPASQTSTVATPRAASPALAKPLNNARDVIAPMGGLFYRAPAPDLPPFVTEGARVEAGQTIALIEAMKMLHPIEAECAGRVIGVLCEDGSQVERNAILMRIEKEA